VLEYLEVISSWEETILVCDRDLPKSAIERDIRFSSVSEEGKKPKRYIIKMLAL